MKHYLVLILLMISVLHSFGQADSTSKWNYDYKTKRYSHFKAEYTYQNYHTIGLGYARVDRKFLYGSCADDIAGESGFSLSADLLFKANNQFLMAPKLGYEITFIILKGKVETAYVTDFSKGDLLIKPQIGLSAFGLFYFLYGMNFRVTDNMDNYNLNKSFFTVGANILLEDQYK